MELMKEWFLWGESDLFFYGIGVIIISGLLPQQKNNWITGGCFAVYAVCELVVTFRFQNWLFAYICLFAGGIALSIGVGRMIRTMVSFWLLHKKKS